jgi:hypothetical protein
VVDAARSIVDWMTVHADKILFGHGKVAGSITAMFLFGSEKLYPLMLSTNGRVIINFGYCSRGPFLPELMRKEWLAQLNQIPGLSLPPDSIDKYLGVPLALLSTNDRVVQFLKVTDWFVSVLKGTTNTAVD